MTRYTIKALEVRSLSRLFRALGDENRLKVVAILTHGELCVCHIESALGLTQPAASRHLGILRAAGVVERRRKGTWVYYRLSEQKDDELARVLPILQKRFVHEGNLRSAHAAVQKECGPTATA